MRPATRRRKVPAHDAFPLRTVAARTGLTPDLIRAWEKRYGVVAPIRGARGARLYSSADIAHLRLLARVVGAGRAIGDVAGLSRAELEQLAAQRPPDDRLPRSAETASPREELVTRVMERLTAFDEASLTHLLGDAVVGLGIRAFVHEVVVPLVYRIGACWAEGKQSIGEEHLLTATLRNLLGGLLHSRTTKGRPIVLATPAGERHEIGLLSVALLAREAAINVVYLGVDLPASEIVLAAERARALVVGLSTVGTGNRSRATRELETLQVALPRECELWLGGADAGAVASEIGSFHGLVLDTLSATEAQLARLVAVGIA
ncbi:MAG TPA: MerR family transcriptional regulator [Candidatus Limnocylindria bacterium]|nr:MerR family transcriptional regulator [Candidatus Limnocylindria bacterium]